MSLVKKELLWEEISKVPANIWGLENRQGALGFGFFGGFVGSYGSVQSKTGPLGVIAWAFIFFYFPIYITLETNPIVALFLILIVSSALLYYLVFREIKYYQLAKKTRYQITEDAIIIKYSFLGFKKTLSIPRDEITYLHLVEYEFDDQLKGSIWIYHDAHVKAYDAVKRERTNLPRIQMVGNYKLAMNILQGKMNTTGF